MTLTEILNSYMVDGEFNDLFIQLFVAKDNTFSYNDFNRIHDTTFTFKQIIGELFDLTGSKVVKYRDPDVEPELFNEFKQAYQFGMFTHVKDWNQYLHDVFGKVLPRSTILNWVAKQHPTKVLGSFIPTNDKNLYAKEEYVQKAAE